MEKENCGCGCMGGKKGIELQGIKAQKPEGEAIPQGRTPKSPEKEQK